MWTSIIMMYFLLLKKAIKVTHSLQAVPQFLTKIYIIIYKQWWTKINHGKTKLNYSFCLAWFSQSRKFSYTNLVMTCLKYMTCLRLAQNIPVDAASHQAQMQLSPHILNIGHSGKKEALLNNKRIVFTGIRNYILCAYNLSVSLSVCILRPL